MKREAEYSQHARIVMAERRILSEWVERVLERPEHTVPDAGHHERILAFGRIPEFGGRWLRVVMSDLPKRTGL